MIPNNKKILIIDDDPGVRESYDQILSAQPISDIMAKGRDLFAEKDQPGTATPGRDYDIALTDCGEAGVSAVQDAVNRRSPFAAAFIDMMMPGIDGAETARQIWRIDPTIKIVIVTPTAITRRMTSLTWWVEKISFTCANPSIRQRSGNLRGH